MNLNELKQLLQDADRETEFAYQNYAMESAAHRAALQIIQFERELYYGDTNPARYVQKIKEIIVLNAEDITNEID